MRNKYRNKRINMYGKTFASIKEARRYSELLLLEKAGAIKDMEMQVKYILIPAQRKWCNEVYESGRKKGCFKQGKLLERECSYYADFVYFDRESNQLVVEDTKGFKTKDYIIKRKLMLFIHGIKINEI